MIDGVRNFVRRVQQIAQDARTPATGNPASGAGAGTPARDRYEPPNAAANPGLWNRTTGNPDGSTTTHSAGVGAGGVTVSENQSNPDGSASGSSTAIGPGGVTTAQTDRDAYGNTATTSTGLGPDGTVTYSQTTSSPGGGGSSGSVTAGPDGVTVSGSERGDDGTAINGSLTVNEDGVSGSAGITGNVGPVGLGFQTSFKIEETEDVTSAEGWTTVTVNGEISGQVSGSASAGQVGVGVGAGGGERTEFRVRMRDEDYAKVESGELPAPDPFNPETLPEGATVVMNSEDFTNTSFEASYNAIALKTNHEVSEGTSIAVERVDEDTVRVTAGPTQGVEENLWLGVKVGPVSAGLGSNRQLDTYQLQTAEFDISTQEGRAAYEHFLTTGEVESGEGVDNVASIDKLDYSHQTSASIGVGDFSLSLDGASSGTNQVVTTYEDGRQTVQTDVRYNDRSIRYEVELDRQGRITSGPDLTVTFSDVDPSYAEMMAEVYGQDDVSYSGDQQVQISLTAEEAMELQSMAYDNVEALNEQWGIEGEYFEEQLADPYGMAQGNFNMLELARAESPAEVAAAMTAGLTNAEGFIEVLFELGIENDMQLPGDYALADA